MQLSNLIGQSRAAVVLRNAIRRDCVSHSYLFSGPEGVGKTTAALLFAQALNCEDEEGRTATGNACGECRACQLIANGSHPDVRLLIPPRRDDTSVIPIEDIRRNFVHDIILKPVMGRYKIYIVDPADRTANLAIHTALKSLEEPPLYAVVILISSRPSLLPDTVHSRCQQVAFQLAGTEAIEQHLLSLDIEAVLAASMARLSGGRVAWAIRTVNRAEILSARKELLALCARIPGLRVEGALRLAEDIKLQAVKLATEDDGQTEDDEEEAEDSQVSRRDKITDRALRSELPWCLDVLASWYRDQLATSYGGSLINSDYNAAISAAAGSHSQHRSEAAINAILTAKQRLQRNANIDLTLEVMAIALL